MRVSAPFRVVVPACLALVASASGCIFVDGGGGIDREDRSPYGDVAFDWSFGGETDCAEAGVDEVDIAIFRSGVLEDEISREPCAGRGLILTDLFEGPYTVVVDAYDRAGVLLYSGDFFVRVRGEETVDVGVVEFAPVDAPEHEAVGALGLFWAFLYPTDDVSEIDCTVAGVDTVGVAVTALDDNAVVFEQERPCTDEGIEIAPLPVGAYALRLTAFQTSGADRLIMYDSGSLSVDVAADELTDLGDVALGRVDESFADFELTWSVVDAADAPSSCEAAALETVVFTIQRVGADAPEDVVTVACDVGMAYRAVFVPGSYTVTGTATATNAETVFAASVTVDARPGDVVALALALAPTPESPPADEPPADEPPADEPPADEPPADAPPADEEQAPGSPPAP